MIAATAGGYLTLAHYACPIDDALGRGIQAPTCKAITASGVIAGEQYFDPRGVACTGAVSLTTTPLNYTGQRRDTTGLLYYHARYDNPALGRFISPDSVVPGNASGGLDGVALKPLTVDFHEPGFATQLANENAQPFWFEMSDQQRQQAGRPWGPANPQALNRYSYTLNNPVRWTDPSGHSVYMSHAQAADFAAFLRNLAWYLDLPYQLAVGSLTLEGIGLKTAALVNEFVKNGITQLLRMMADKGLITWLSTAAISGPLLEAILAGAVIDMHLLANRLKDFADLIDSNNGDKGTIIGSDCGLVVCNITIINRDNSSGVIWSPSRLTAAFAGISGGDYTVGRGCEVGGGTVSGEHWSADTRVCH